jgi:hypothetical protein
VECQFPPTPQPMVGDPSTTTTPCAPLGRRRRRGGVGAARATPVALRARGAEQRHHPVAHHLVHGASVGWTASIMRSSTGSRSLRASSGSRSASNSIESLRSAKRTVTCLRSPSRAALDVRIFSARCFGVYASGDVNRGSTVACDATGVPHLPEHDQYGEGHAQALR